MIAIVAAAVASAGWSTGSVAGLDPVAKAATQTESAGAAHVQLALTFSSGSHSVAVNGTGVVDGTSTDMSFQVGSLTGAIPSKLGLTAAQIENATLREITVEQSGDYVLYLGSSLLASYMPGGQQWVKLDLSTLAQARGLDLNQLLAGSSVSPADVLAMLSAEGDQVQNLGPATAGGVTATHYHVTVDTAKALQTSGIPSSVLSQIAANLPTIPVDVWIGTNDGLVHKLQTNVTLESASTPATFALTATLSDYGTNATISPPSASDVFDATALASAASANSSS